MIEEPTCLILGAGASAPYGLPTAEDLRNLILPLRSEGGAAAAKRFPLKIPPRGFVEPDNKAKEWHIYLSNAVESAHLQHLQSDFITRFGNADRSIDWFLRGHESTFGEIARLYVASVVLACEREDKLSGDWYRLLSEEIIPRNLESFEEGRLSVISFNYDRSFERYFLSQFKDLCDFTAEEAIAALGKIRLEHVYGQLGTLDYVPYGNYERAFTASQQILTIRLEPDEAVKTRIGKVIKESTYINFVGFGFDDDNIDLLGPENFKGKRVYSTTYGLSARTLAKARQKFGVQISTKEPPALKAAQLLNEKDLFGPKKEPRGSPLLAKRRARSDWMKI